MTGWIESSIPYPQRESSMPTESTKKRHVIGDDLDDRVRRLPAVLREPRVIGPHNR